MPESAKENTKEGLEAFTGYWTSLISYAYETGDTQPMKAVAEPTCSSCISWAADATDANWESGWAVGGKISVVEFSTDFQPLADKSISSWVTFRQEALTLYSRDGAIKNQVEAGQSAPLEVLAKYEDGAWRIVNAGTA